MRDQKQAEVPLFGGGSTNGKEAETERLDDKCLRNLYLWHRNGHNIRHHDPIDMAERELKGTAPQSRPSPKVIRNNITTAQIKKRLLKFVARKVISNISVTLTLTLFLDILNIVAC